MRYRNISIGQRMGLGFGLLLVIVAGLLAEVFHLQAGNTQAERTYTERVRPLSMTARRVESALLRTGIGVRAYLLAPDGATLQQHDDNMRAARAELANLGTLARQADGEDLFRQAAPLVGRYLEEANALVGQRRNGPVGRDAEMQISRTRESALAALKRFTDLQDRKAEQSIAAMQTGREEVDQALLVAGLLALLCLGTLAWFTIQSVRKPAHELVRVAAALQSGDWNPALDWAPVAGDPSPGREPRSEMLRIAHAFGTAARALERREQRLAADAQVSAAAGSSLAKEEVAGRALQAIAGHVRAEVGAVYWYGGDDGTLVPIASQGLGASAQPIAPGEGIPGQAALERRTLLVRDIPRDSPFQVKLGYDKAPPRTVVALPIAFRGEVRGVLVLASLRDFDAAAIEFLEFAAAQLGIGLSNVAAYEEKQRLLAELNDSHQRIQAQNEELQAQNEEIQSQNEELQAQAEEIQSQNDQLKVQAEQLRQDAQVLVETDQRKTEFLGLLAHELRNPMAGISTSLHVLSRVGADSEHAANAHAVIARQTRQLGRLIDDLLDITRISRGKIELQRERVDLVEVLQECLEDNRATFENASLTVDLHVAAGPITVDGDRARLCQVICNLIDNAVKFNDPGKRIAISLERDVRACEARLCVEDNGVGIALGFLDRLFLPFSQGDPSLGRRQGGLGLGLALVKALVDLHGGSVQAHSDGPGTGARFVVTLPLLARNAGRQEPSNECGNTAERPASSREACRILVIEDNADAAESLRAALALEGHEVRVACSGMEGLEAARSFAPDVLLCDIGLPVIDGYEVARRFRADERLKSVRLVAVTGYAAAHDRLQAVQAGFDHHFPKPPDMERLSALLAQVAISKASASSREPSA